jgi:hypothetical protein
MRKLKVLLSAVLLVGLGLVVTPTTSVGAAPDAPIGVESVERPAHNPDNLALFSCAVRRPNTGHPDLTINHSHKNDAASTVDIFGQPAITAFDCEGYENPGLDGCLFRVYYVHENKLNGSDLGILEAVNITCFGFD